MDETETPEQVLELEPGPPPDVEGEAEPTDPYAGLPTQADVDIQTIVGNLSQYSQQLSAAKLGWHAARAGVPNLEHPNKIAKDIKALHSICDLLVLFLHEEKCIPDPPSVLLPDEA